MSNNKLEVVIMKYEIFFLIAKYLYNLHLKTNIDKPSRILKIKIKKIMSYWK